MLFSQARGKVGDLVFSRLDGEQIVRSRNRHPKNPKTNAQLYQRAIMATVLRAYSAGKVIFDHAFEGKQVGAQCQRYFLSENAKRLRAAIAADLANNRTGDSAMGHVGAPGIIYSVPNGYLVSQGTLAPSPIRTVTGLPSPNEGEKLGEYANRLGLVNDDFHTYVCFGCSASNNEDDIVFQVDGTTSPGACQTKGGFGFVRFKVAISDADLQTVVTNATLMSKIFVVDAVYNLDMEAYAEMPIHDDEWSSYIGYISGGTWSRTMSGVIHSRENEGLRSTCELQKEVDENAWGIESLYVLPAWSQGSAVLGDSDLILEGGDL